MEQSSKVLLLDEKRSDLLNGIFNSLIKDNKRLHGVILNGDYDTFMAICKELNDARHEGGWCKDKECPIPNQTNNI